MTTTDLARELQKYITGGARPGDQELAVLVPVRLVSAAATALSEAAQADNETVATMEDLKALPVGAILVDDVGDGIEIVEGGIHVTGAGGRWSWNWVAFPARVLYRPTKGGDAE